MQIEYRRNMKQSLMIVQTEEYYRGYELEMCAKNRIAGLLSFETVVADGEMQFWYDITGMQSLDTFLTTRPVTVSMLEKLVQGVAWACECMRPYLLDDNKLLLRADTIYFDSSMERTCLAYCPSLQGDAGVSLRQVFEYLLPKLDYADDHAVQTTYALYQAAVVEQAGIERLVELLGADTDMISSSMEEQASHRMDDSAEEGLERPIESLKQDRQPDDTDGPAKNKKNCEIFKKLNEKVSNLCASYKPHLDGATRPRKQKKHMRKNSMQEICFEPEEEVVEHPTVYLGGIDVIQESEKRKEVCVGRLLRPGMGETDGYAIGDKPLVIGGRYGDADIHLDSDGVSRIHAIVGKNAEGEYYVEDMNSINGTYVNGDQLAYHYQCILHKNDEIAFATEVFLFT